MGVEMNTTITLGLAALAVYAWIRNNRHPSKRHQQRRVAVPVTVAPRHTPIATKRYSTLGQLTYNIAYLYHDMKTAWRDASRVGRAEVTPRRQMVQTTDPVLDLTPWRPTMQAVADARYVAQTNDDLLKDLFARSEPVNTTPIPVDTTPVDTTGISPDRAALIQVLAGLGWSRNRIAAGMGGNRNKTLAMIGAVLDTGITGTEALQSAIPPMEPIPLEADHVPTH